MKLTEVVTGTPEERTAHQTVKSFKSHPPTNYRERRELAQASVLKRKLTRRQMGLAVAGIAMTAIGGLAYRELSDGETFDEGPIYSGPIPELAGLPEVTEKDFELMTENLSSTEIPFLQKLSGGVTVLHESASLPQEITEIVAKDALPLPVVINKASNESLAALRIAPDTIRQYAFTRLAKPEQTDIRHPAQPVYPGIVLGGANFQTHDAGDALFLAESHATSMVFMQCFTEAYAWITANVGSLTRVDGSPITDTAEQQRIGISLIADALRRNDAQRLILDNLPTFLIASALRDGNQTSGITSEDAERMNMQVVVRYLRDPSVNQLTQEIRDAWTANSAVLPSQLPQMLMDYTFLPNPLSQAIISYSQDIGVLPRESQEPLF